MLQCVRARARSFRVLLLITGLMLNCAYSQCHNSFSIKKRILCVLVPNKEWLFSPRSDICCSAAHPSWEGPNEARHDCPPAPEGFSFSRSPGFARICELHNQRWRTGQSLCAAFPVDLQSYAGISRICASIYLMRLHDLRKAEHYTRSFPEPRKKICGRLRNCARI